MNQDRLDIIRRYSAGELGTRETLELADLRDYGDLIVALATHDLPFPKPRDTPRRAADLARIHAILQPRLRTHDD